MIPPEIPGYTYVEPIGRGGYSEVLKYEQHRPRRTVAIKVIRADHLDPRQLGRFTAEADAMAQLSLHPFIVTVLAAAVTDDGRPYLVMDYYPPPDLGALVRTQPLSLSSALRTGIQLASAVETAHRGGILHRDIKPANVLLSKYEAPGLTDFGIAGDVGRTDEDEELGVSIPWSPPEVLNGTSNGSVASDVYSLGATIWHVLTGHSPFWIAGGDNSAVAVQSRIYRDPPPSTGRPEVPPGLDRVLQHAMAKNPDHRPASALELARSLQRIEQECRFGRTELVVENIRTAAADRSEVDDDRTELKRSTRISPQPRVPEAPATAAPSATRASTPAVPFDELPTENRSDLRAGPPAASATDLDVRPDAEERATVPASRARWLWAATGAVVLAGVVAAVIATTGGPDHTPGGTPRTTGVDPGGGLDPDMGISVGAGTRRGSTVLFRITWPNGEDPDAVLRWTPGRKDHPTGPEQPVTDNLVVAPLQPKSRPTCITVRYTTPDSSTDPNPQESCFP